MKKKIVFPYSIIETVTEKYLLCNVLIKSNFINYISAQTNGRITIRMQVILQQILEEFTLFFFGAVIVHRNLPVEIYSSSPLERKRGSFLSKSCSGRRVPSRVYTGFRHYDKQNSCNVHTAPQVFIALNRICFFPFTLRTRIR